MTDERQTRMDQSSKRGTPKARSRRGPVHIFLASVAPLRNTVDGRVLQIHGRRLRLDLLCLQPYQKAL